jgi:tetratricopeptide (TPR) repeat protein
MYDPSIMARFGERRYFVTYETASEPRELLARVVEALGLAPSGDEASLLRQIETSTDSIPAALLLDNLDPLFDANRAEAERLLQLVAQLPNLVLLGTIRGVAPSVPGAVIIEDLAKLSVASAERAFLSVAGEALASDPDLSSLLVALDGHALSIRIVAAQAQGLPSLAGIREAWEEEHAAMLRHPSEDEGRLTSVRASLAISLKSKRLKKAPIARRLLALLAQLPAGLAEPDVRALLGERGLVSRTKAREAVTVVHQLRLVERRPDQRLRMLTPLRESVKLDISLIAADRDRLCLHFMAIAKLGSHYATSKWTVAKTILDVEADNLDPVCLIAAQSDITSDRLYRALVGLCRFVNVVGSGGLKSVYFAHDLYIQEHMYMEAAAITSELGDMAYARSRFDEAHTLFMESYKLSISSGNKLAQANALYGIGDVETALSRHQEAINNFGKALVLYRSISDGNGVANCLFRLGMIASREGEEEKAKASLREAAALYTKCASPLGRGNCEMMLSRFDPETAEACLLAVQSVFRELGAPLSYVSCLIRLGENALQNNETGKAIEWFKEAQALSRPNGNVSGEAHAMIREGQAHRAIGDEYAANMLIEKGFKLWWAVTSERDRTYEGWQALEKYLLNRFSGDSGAARDVIRCKWNPVGRKDLVEDWVDFEPRVSG